MQVSAEWLEDFAYSRGRRSSQTKTMPPVTLTCFTQRFKEAGRISVCTLDFYEELLIILKKEREESTPRKKNIHFVTLFHFYCTFFYSFERTELKQRCLKRRLRVYFFSLWIYLWLIIDKEQNSQIAYSFSKYIGLYHQK